MGSRSRIRWHKVLKLGAGVFGCLALFLGLPSLIRRPEPPPLESDIGLVHIAASREPAPSGQRGARRERRATARGRDRQDRSRGATRRPTSREEVRPSTRSPVTGVTVPAPAPVPDADGARSPAPPVPPPPTPPPAPAAAPQPAAQTEFGFER